MEIESDLRCLMVSVGLWEYLDESCYLAVYCFSNYTYFLLLVDLLSQGDNEDEELCSVFVPTNHLYIGDILLVNSKEIIRPNISIREGIGISTLMFLHRIVTTYLGLLYY